MDFIVGLPRARSGYDFLWIIVDRLTKVAHFIPVKTTHTEPQLAGLYMSRIACLHRIPKRNLSYFEVLGKIARDQGHPFELQFCLSPLD
jgi:hypothetical protein